MKEATHTPGPWDYFVGNANGRGLIRVETAHDAPVAGVHIASAVRGAESEANARLIAAAPDMLAALKAMVLNDTHTYRDCHRAALAAIAKAEGR